MGVGDNRRGKVHWSDAATKEFIAYLLDSVPRSQILIILTTRPDYTAPVEERSFVSRLALNHLSETESKEMGERVLASAGLP